MADGEAGIDRVDVAVVGGGPAGLSATLNLARAMATVALVDAGRPRNAATLRSHGFITRDGVTPIELRKLAGAELAGYDGVRVFDRSTATRIARDDSGRLVVEVAGRQAPGATVVVADAVLLATGLRELLPDLPGIRSFYGMSFFSCVPCDGWELRGRTLALIGETDDLFERARHLSRWTDALTVFSNGSAAVTAGEEDELRRSGIPVERAAIAAIEGHRGEATGVRLVDGRVIPVHGGFVRPRWDPGLDALDGIVLDRDADGFVLTDPDGRTRESGLYAAGDIAAPGPQQMIIAAGLGARAAAALVMDRTGSLLAPAGAAAGG